MNKDPMKNLNKILIKKDQKVITNNISMYFDYNNSKGQSEKTISIKTVPNLNSTYIVGLTSTNKYIVRKIKC